MLTARDRTVRLILESNPRLTEADVKTKLVAYSSDQSNSSVEKAGIIGSMTMRLLPSDENGSLRGETLKETLSKDKENGLYPCFVIGTLGTTGTCAFDDLEEIGPICNEENVWLHIDAAYAGTAFSCPEYRYLMKGVKHADSFNFNAHKWMLVNFDCSPMWVKDARNLVNAFNVERIYLKDSEMSKLPEYRNWQIPLGRRFRSLKLWFVLRTYGVEGIQNHVRSQIALAKHFERLVRNDGNFEVCTARLGLITFRLKGEDALTQRLLDLVTNRKNICIIPCHYRNKLVIRFVICSRLTNIQDITRAWGEIRSQANVVFGLPDTDVEENIVDPILVEKCKFDAIKINSNSSCIEKTK